MDKGRYDVVIIGAGIMGLLGAYQIVRTGGRVAVIDKAEVGNKLAGSSGLTRSLRSDYADPLYARLARLSWQKWLELEQELGLKLVLQTGCLNLATTAAGPSYAKQAAAWLARDKSKPEVLVGGQPVSARFPQFIGMGYAVYEEAAGLGFPNAALPALKARLADCTLLENTEVTGVMANRQSVTVLTDKGRLTGRKLILAAGLGTPELLQKLKNAKVRLELLPERPAECVYYIPQNPVPYTSDNLPVFACLDVGIYGHPVVVGRTKGVKIGRYNPPGSVNQTFEASGETIADFVGRYMPELAATATRQKVTDTDQCAYDMTADGGFAVGPLTRLPNVMLAAGFCGTGYKFAPAIAELMSDFALSKPYRYDMAVFNPERFNV